MVVTYAVDADVLERDLTACGLTLVGRADNCDCAVCIGLDQRFVTDVLAQDKDRRPVLVGHRHQSEYDYNTMTFRETNDSGNTESEVHKIAHHQSLAQLHIHSYQNHLLRIAGNALRVALKAEQDCPRHAQSLLGRHGQRFVILCPECSPAMTRINL